MKKAIQSLVLGLSCTFASPCFGEAISEKVIVVEEAKEFSDWRFTIAAYSWVTAVDGEVGIQGLTASADTSISEVLKDLDVAYMAQLEIGYKRWSLGVDGLYAKFSTDANYQYGPISGGVSVEMEQAFLTGRLQYRLIDAERYTLDLFAGARWSYVDIDTDVHVALKFKRPFLQRFNRAGSRRFNLSEDWVDPIVGFRGVVNVDSSVYLLLSGDIGGFGVGSDLTWQAMAGVGYNFTPRISTMLGYRALAIDYDRNGFKMDTISYGPLAALVIKL